VRARFVSLVILMATITFGCKSPQTSQTTWKTSGSGLGIQDLVPGQGPSPRPGQSCVVEAMGWVETDGARGHVFLDTRKRGYPMSFPIASGRIIQGWEEGLATMAKGGKRLLRVPPSLGYSPRELGQDIPPGSTLIFELELVDIR